MRLRQGIGFCLLAGMLAALAPQVTGDEPAKIKIASLTLQPPKTWVKKQPRSRIVEYEFAAPKAEGDSQDGRVTLMVAGGSIKDNIQRWAGQFRDAKQPKVTTEKLDNGVEVHLVDISGVYMDKQGGPFSRTPAVARKDYRMLSAIVVIPNSGQLFVKMYGPAKTIAANEKAFETMVTKFETK